MSRTPRAPVLLHYKFRDFMGVLNSSFESGVSVETEIQNDSNGYEWKIKMFPGGTVHSDEGFVAAVLSPDEHITRGAKPNVKCQFSIKNSKGQSVHEIDFIYPVNNGSAAHNFIRRSDLLDNPDKYLIDDCLYIDVSIQISPLSRNILARYGRCSEYTYPMSPLSKNMLALYESQSEADLIFNIDDEVFKAHSLIINANAPILAESYKKKDNSEITVDIYGTSPKVFNVLLRYIYSAVLPDLNDMLEYGRQIIDTANKYDIVELKSVVEAELVRCRVLDKKNVCDWLLFADSTVCLQMKNYAISFLKLHAREVLASEHSSELKESPELMMELFLSAIPEHRYGY